MEWRRRRLVDLQRWIEALFIVAASLALAPVVGAVADDWKLVVGDGFGDRNNVAVVDFHVYHDALYAGTGRSPRNDAPRRRVPVASACLWLACVEHPTHFQGIRGVEFQDLLHDFPGQVGLVELLEAPNQSLASLKKRLISSQPIGKHSTGRSAARGLGPKLERVAKMAAGQGEIVVQQCELSQQQVGVHEIAAPSQEPAQFVPRDLDLAGIDHLADFLQILAPVERAARRHQFPGLLSRHRSRPHRAARGARRPVADALGSPRVSVRSTLG